jgi:ABC-type uncharacterized transport system substrate-binding protein
LKYTWRNDEKTAHDIIMDVKRASDAVDAKKKAKEEREAAKAAGIKLPRKKRVVST